jgi:type I restriction enzyme S subunit
MIACRKLLPILRFPEFDGEWIEKNLGSVADSILYGIGSSAKAFDGRNKYLRITDIDEGSNVFSPNPLTSPEGEINEKYILKTDDIVFARTGASVGKTYLYNENDGRLVFAGFLIKFSITRAEPKFVFYTTLRASYQKWVSITSMRSGQPGINAEEYKLYQFYLPQLKEQQKIASFLTAIDRRIQLLQQKQSKLESYKKGVMQKLFSREIRFKDEHGNDFPEWVERKISDLYSFKPTNSYSREKLNYESGSVKNIHYGDIHTKFKTHLDLTNERVPFLNSDLDIKRINTDSFVQEGDLIIADASEDYADIGKAVEVCNTNDEKVVAGLHTFLLRRKENALIVGFGGHLMQNFQLRLDIKRIAQGTKVLSLSATRLGELSVKIPSLEEQQKIASFLSSLDLGIEKVGQQINQMQVFKKGLLQKMFV